MVTAIVLSGGKGTRFGEGIPKQYRKHKDKMVISYCFDALISNANIDRLQIVANEEWHKDILECLNNCDKFLGFSKPGATRQMSIVNALEDIANVMKEDDYIFIHDAARPLLSKKLIDSCVAKVKEIAVDGVLPVLPMKDTVYLSEDGKSISSLLDRSKVVAGQAPEAFVYGAYVAANKALMPDKILSINGSTEPAMLAGMNVAIIDGDENNFKITTQADWDRFVDCVE